MGRPLKDNILFFSHDADSPNNWKFAALHLHYPGEKGWAMEGRFWALNCMIADAEACRLDLGRRGVEIDTARRLGISVEELREFIGFLSDKEACDLLNKVDGVVWTDRCQEELERVRKSRKHDRDRKGPDIPDGKQDNPAGKTSTPTPHENIPPGKVRNGAPPEGFPGKQQNLRQDNALEDSNNSNEIS